MELCGRAWCAGDLCETEIAEQVRYGQDRNSHVPWRGAGNIHGTICVLVLLSDGPLQRSQCTTWREIGDDADAEVARSGSCPLPSSHVHNTQMYCCLCVTAYNIVFLCKNRCHIFVDGRWSTIGGPPAVLEALTEAKAFVYLGGSSLGDDDRDCSSSAEDKTVFLFG